MLKFPSPASEPDQPTPSAETSQQELQRATDTIMDTGRLFLRNLPFICRDEDLRPVLEKHGQLAELQIIVDKQTGQCKGYAIAAFVFPEHALKAYTQLDGSIFKGRMLHVLPGEEAKEKADAGGRDDFGLSKFQKQRKRAQKADSASGGYSWNALFLGTSAVAEAMAERLEVEKRDLMVGDDENRSVFGVEVLKLLELLFITLQRRHPPGNGRSQNGP